MPFSSAIASAFKAIQNAAGVSVNYERDGATVAIAKAVPGKSEFERPDDFGITTHMRTRDWLIDAADLVLFGNAVEPAEGDLIHEAVGSTTLVWQVMPPGGEEAAWRFSDDLTRQTYRIHCKLLRTDTPV